MQQIIFSRSKVTAAAQHRGLPDNGDEFEGVDGVSTPYSQAAIKAEDMEVFLYEILSYLW